MLNDTWVHMQLQRQKVEVVPSRPRLSGVHTEVVCQLRGRGLGQPSVQGAWSFSAVMTLLPHADCKQMYNNIVVNLS